MFRTRIAAAPIAPFTALLLIALLVPTAPRTASAMCCPIPCDDCELLSFGQMNFVVMDRAASSIRLIPNIRIVGTAPDFSLIIPTPTAPTLEPAPKEIWTELSALTAPITSTGSSGDGLFNCSSNDAVFGTGAGPEGDGNRDDVDIISRQTVGAFIATTISSEAPDALVRWLRDNGFPVTDTEAAAFTPLIERHWVFTAMKLDGSRPEGRMPPDGWNNAVDPVQLSFAAPALEVPLDMLAINRGDRLPMAFFVVDDHRTDLPGFATNYANKLSRNEASAIAKSYPHVADYVASGRFITRLDRTFSQPEPMSGLLTLARASTDAEFRQVRGNTFFGSFGLEGLLWLSFPWIARRTRRGNRRRTA